MSFEKKPKIVGTHFYKDQNGGFKRFHKGSKNIEKEAGQIEVDLDFGDFNLDYLSTGSIDIETSSSKVRNNSADLARLIAIKRANAPIFFRRSNFIPKKGQNLDDLHREIVDKFPNAANRLTKDVMQNKINVAPGFTPFVGGKIRQRFEGRLSLDIKPVTFSEYQVFSDPEMENEYQEIGNAFGTACSLVLENNGKPVLILQKRGVNNAFYKGVFGASVGGFLDGHFDPNKRGKLSPVNSEYIVNNIRKEAEEEFGLRERDMDNITIDGVATDKVKLHQEFLLSASLNMEISEFKSIISKRKNENRANDSFDFEGEFELVRYDLETLETLLFEILIPFPSTHLATMLVLAYKLQLDKMGRVYAKKWLLESREKLKIKQIEMNKRVSKFTNWKFLTYNPAFLPEEQGLLSLDEASSILSTIRN